VPSPTAPDRWVALTAGPLPVIEALAWATVPSCGGVVAFCGTVRDHAEDREGVTGLTYEAYESQALGRFEAVVAEARTRFPGLGRVAVLHRVGDLAVTDVAVCVVASAPHRDEAFAAARYCIDAVKATAPIWKQEHWGDGSVGWGTGAQALPSTRSASRSRIET
jgi:molybdopterin synthase catalytic subunit